jgi:hypothetical protein
MVDGANGGHGVTAEMQSGKPINIANRERVAALLCVLVVTAGAIFGLMYMLGYGSLSQP